MHSEKPENIRPSRRVGIVTVGTLLYSLGFQEMTRDGSKNRKREAYQESLVHVWHTWSADRSQPIKLAIAAYFLCSASFLRQIRLNRRSRSISTFEVYSGCFRNNGYRDSRAYERLGSTASEPVHYWNRTTNGNEDRENQYSQPWIRHFSYSHLKLFLFVLNSFFLYSKVQHRKTCN